MRSESNKHLTRRELMARSGAAAGALLFAGPAGALDADASDTAVTLPDGVKAVWDLKSAYAEKTPTRERVCLNGLWHWQPARETADVPTGNWGWFKVPGPWPGITDYLQKDSQTLYPHPAWSNDRLGGVTEAWYQREITVPGDWTGRRKQYVTNASATT